MKPAVPSKPKLVTVGMSSPATEPAIPSAQRPRFIPSPAPTRRPAPSPARTRRPAPSPAPTRRPAPSPAPTRHPVPSPARTRRPAPSPARTRRPAPSRALTRHPVPSPAPILPAVRAPAPRAPRLPLRVVPGPIHPAGNGRPFNPPEGEPFVHHPGADAGAQHPASPLVPRS